MIYGKIKYLKTIKNLHFLFLLYIDDLEINNPLGSHANYQSISAIYYNFPLNENNSLLSHIFLASLIKSKDFKEFGNDVCLKNLIDEINYLEKEGIQIKTKSGPFQIYFGLGLVLGDNLGVNTILEFSKSFSANYFCRFCKAHKSITQSMTTEDSTLMRTNENYDNDVLQSDFRQTGIYQKSILNNITNFHVTKNYSVDIMHDLFEGVCHYNICHIINYYIETIQLFTLKELNNRKSAFNYGSFEIGNYSPPILDVHLKKFRLKMSAREKWTFIHYFSLMIGDLIPLDDEVWIFFINFLKLIDLLLSYSFTEDSVLQLQQLIKINNDNYVKLFNDTLKPKHHLLVHYPTVIRQSGPPRHFWCFRFEGKHKEMKTYARVTSSRKNITLTLAKKFQLKYSYFLMKSPKSELIVFDKNEITINETVQNIIFNRTNLQVVQYKMYKEIQYRGTTYKENLYLIQGTSQHFIFEISAVLLVIKNNKIMILAKKFLLNNLNEHYLAYEIPNEPQIYDELSINNIDTFSGPPLNIIKISNGQTFVRLKEFF